MKKLLVLLVLALALVIGVSAKEVVIYENDFSNSDLSDFYIKGTKGGTMEVTESGTLKAIIADAGTGTSAYVSYDIPAEHHGKDYIVEVDYINPTRMGGILVGASGVGVKPSSYFTGYTVTTDGSAKQVYYAFFNETGWGGDFGKNPTSPITGKDIHLWVYVSERAMTFRATSLDGETLYQGSRYDYGFHPNDIYDTRGYTVGLRQYYADTGYFDNFKVSVVEPDVIPTLGSSVTVGGTAFASNGITAENGVISGSGVMISKDALSGNYRISGSVANKNMSRIYFGMSADNKNGYALDIDSYFENVTLNKIENGEFKILQIRKTVIREGYVNFYVDVHDGIVTISYDNFFAGEEALPTIELYLNNTDGKFGFWLEGGQIKDIASGDAKITLPEETYTNNVNIGADPYILFHNGTYYLYVYMGYSGNNGNEIFDLYTSSNLVDWKYCNKVFPWDSAMYSNVDGKTAWSPNMFYNEADGLFYLTFAAEGFGSDTVRKVYYASSDSPYGPFVHDGPLVALNDMHECDGNIFVGYDGKTYMSYSRYDAKATVWIGEVIVKDGVITAVPENSARAVIPDAEWENDGALFTCEGGFVWKHNGYYYLIYATSSYERHYGQCLAISKNPTGPYEKVDYNPILNWNYIIDGPGDANIVQSPDGTEAYMLYHRHIVPGDISYGRETCIDLVKFVKNPDGGPDILTVAGPSSTPKALPSNQYRYDVNRDGSVTIADAMTVLRYVRNGSMYNGWYDVDGNGSIGVSDVLALMQKIK